MRTFNTVAVLLLGMVGICFAGTPATMTSPAPGSTLSSAEATFTWTAGSGVSQYHLTIGTLAGGSDIDYINAGTSTSTTVTNLPTNGEHMYVTLWSEISGTWYKNGYTYYASGTGAAAVMTNPSGSGAVMASASQTFTWSAGSGISQYILIVGTVPGGHDIDLINTGRSTSATVSNLPTNGGVFYVSIYSLNGKNWLHNGYNYIASGKGTPGAILTPTPGSTLSKSSVTFTWSAGSGVSQFILNVGTSGGSYNLDYVNAGRATSATITNVPLNDLPIYVTLRSLIGVTWFSYTYTYSTYGTPILVSVAITPPNPTIAAATSQQLMATGTYSDNSAHDVTNTATWSSSNTTVATVGNTTGTYGIASGKAAGTSTIKATVGSISGITNLTVTSATVASVAVTPLVAGIALDSTQPFKATATLSDNSQQDVTAFATWSTSPTGIASVSKGIATGNAAGSTTVSAAFGGMTGTAGLSVSSATLSYITVNPIDPAIAAGTTQPFTATGNYSDGTTQDLTTASTWSSDTTSAATISNSAGSNGLATGVAAGSANITATANSVSGSAMITVTSPTLVSIAVSPANPKAIVGATQQFVATGTFSDNTQQDITQSVLWTSSNAGVAAISNATGSKGLAYALGAGTSTIAAQSGSVTGQTTITIPVTYSLSGTVTVGGTTPLPSVTLTLSSGASTLTDAKGNYTFNGLANGSYTITPSLGGYTFSPTSLTVTLSSASRGGNNFTATATSCPSVSGMQTLEIDPGAGPSPISATSPDGLYALWAGTLNAASGTYNVTSSGAYTPNTFVMTSVGAVCGLGGITSIPTTGYQATLALKTGYGYVGTIGDGTYVRFYVTSESSGPIIDIQYEYPMTICPAHTRLVFGDQTTFNGSPAHINEQNSTGTQTNFAFVGCKGTATVQAWGAGGAGGQDTISFYGGNGGGGGGGGGYGSQQIVMVPGQWYVVSVGIGGQTNFPSPIGTGGTSGFSIEAGASLMASTGGSQGTDAGGTTSAGTGGSGGGSNAKVSQPGLSGSNGQTNYNLGLCGGPGSIGPGGAGGAGGGAGGAGGSGGCAPSAPSAPGGGGSGGSQYDANSNGADGQVIIDF